MKRKEIVELETEVMEMLYTLRIKLELLDREIATIQSRAIAALLALPERGPCLHYSSSSDSGSSSDESSSTQ